MSSIRRGKNKGPEREYDYNLKGDNPCTFQYIKSNHTPSSVSDPAYKILKYAVKEDITYENAAKKCKKQINSSGRTEDSLAMGKGDVQAIEKLIELDKRIKSSTIGFVNPLAGTLGF